MFAPVDVGSGVVSLVAVELTLEDVVLSRDSIDVSPSSRVDESDGLDSAPVLVLVTVTVVEVTVAPDSEDPSSRVAVAPSAEEAADPSVAVSQMLLVVVVQEDEAS